MRGLENFQLLNVKNNLEHNKFLLEDKSGAILKLGFEFYGIDDLEIGDKVVISKALLDPANEKFCIPYAFRFIKYCQLEDKNKLSDDDYIIVKKGRKTLLLKRIYG